MKKRPSFSGPALSLLLLAFVVACVPEDTSVGQMNAPGPDGGGPLCTAGETMPAGDGCNTCTCAEGTAWLCTEIGCGEPPLCTAGETMPAGDGCNTCTCAEGTAWLCTEIGCGEPPLCTAGETMPAGDGCNTCICVDGTSWDCTTAFCAEPDCTDADAQRRETYEAWTMLPNELGELTGRTFSGYVEGGPDLILTIDADGNADLAVGEPAPAAEADLGYLCDKTLHIGQQCPVGLASAPVEGAVYPLHGASFTAGRLIAPIQPYAPYDAWCALQTPHLTDVCFFEAMGPEGFSVGFDDMCSLDGRAVDCAWLELVMYGGCACTSSDCFASIHSPTSVQIDARFDDATRELSGGFIDTPRATRFEIHLFEVTE